MNTVHQPLGILSIDSLHFFVSDLERSRAHYIERLSFSETAVSSRAFEAREGARASLLEAGSVRFVFLAPLREHSESADWLRKHPEGVGCIVFSVADVAHAHGLLVARGATMVSGLERDRTEQSELAWFDIATPFGDTLFRFVERRDGAGLLPRMERTAGAMARTIPSPVAEIDHITSNFLTLQPAVAWLEQVLGFERYWSIAFHTQDVTGEQTGGSGLRSIVMWDPSSGIKFANNEPAAPAYRASQIYRFCVDHGGAGVQHVALTVADILGSVRSMREQGVAFMPTPKVYYERLPQRLVALGIEQIEESASELGALDILVDGDGPGRYLLQIFCREASALFEDAAAGPFFIELIQRKGDRGFGAGNFRALFESIERQQSCVRAA